LKKGNWDPKKGIAAGDATVLSEPAERRLALHVAAFPKAVLRAGNELAPAVITQWCFGMAQRVNDFYRDVNVLESAEPMRAARLRLVASALSVLVVGLDLLGISLPEEM
jgi:arginyl-tRNA synthetase